MSQVFHTVISAGTSSAEALAANSGRKYVYFQNDSDTVIYLGVGLAAILNSGFRLAASGGDYEFSESKGNLVKEVINCISSGSSKNLLITEITE